MSLPDGRSTSIELALHTCIRVTRFRARPARNFASDPTLCWYLLIQRIYRVSPAAGGTAHTSFICLVPTAPINGFWSYQFVKLMSSDRCDALVARPERNTNEWPRRRSQSIAFAAPAARGRSRWHGERGFRLVARP